MQEMVIPSLHKLMVGSCQGATCCELGVTRGGLRTPGCQSPLMLPGISTEGVRSVGGDNYKGNGRVDLAERESSRRSE